MGHQSSWSRECGSKARFSYAEKAQAAASRICRTSGDIMEAYHCSHCRAWHIGHPQDTPLRPGARRAPAREEEDVA